MSIVLDVDVLTVIRRLRAAALGDDSLIVVPAEFGPIDPDRIRTVSALFGFDVDVVVSKSLARVDFCSGLFWPVGDGHVFGPKIGRYLQRSASAVLPITCHDAMAWLRGAAYGRLRDVAFIPVLRAHNARVLELLKHTNRSTKWRERSDALLLTDNKIHAQSFHCATGETMEFVLDRYGLTELDVSRIEAAISGMLLHHDVHLPEVLCDL